jgi:ketosteroid isomerase-like protein
VGEARQVLDALTDAIFSQDADAILRLYDRDAVAITPDRGELHGHVQIMGHMMQFMSAFPDAKYELQQAYESGNTAIDEGYFVGTNTGSLVMEHAESLAPTGKHVRMRACDLATVENGVVTSHRLYFDQMEFLGQLGLLPDMPS